MKRIMATAVAVAIGAVFASAAWAPRALATVSEDGICWDPDVETPVECDSDED